ncbi:MAG: DNA cytosine methyltransferase [Butyrivibrio sp.]|nr:DNA cytosine methyltransferase [Butyrivibrio sp.]
MKMNNFIDLFSGAGGFLRGFMDAGLKPEFSVEVWEPAIQTHKRNYPDVPVWDRDIRTIKDSELEPYKGKVDIIIGGPPCQGFSTIGKRLVKDPRNELVFEFIRFVDVIKPKVFLMENVKGLLSANNGLIKDAITAEFEAKGYNVIHQVVCAADYGVPQMRYRVLFLGIRKDIDIIPSFPAKIYEKEKYATVGDAIMDLVGKENVFPNHVPMHHNAVVTKRISCIKEGEGIPDSGLPDDVAKGSRSDYADNTIKNFSHVYKRLSRFRPATTMVPGHNAFPLHPTENRSLTVREAARIQTFPDDVIFEGNRQNQCIQVGNAVPVKLAEVLANHIITVMEDVDGSNA